MEVNMLPFMYVSKINEFRILKQLLYLFTLVFNLA